MCCVGVPHAASLRAVASAMVPCQQVQKIPDEDTPREEANIRSKWRLMEALVEARSGPTQAVCRPGWTSARSPCALALTAKARGRNLGGGLSKSYDTRRQKSGVAVGGFDTTGEGEAKAARAFRLRGGG